MDPIASVHPADETLVSYGLGKLDDTRIEAVSKHLEQCDPCRRRVAELSSDSFVGRLREAQPQPGDAPPRTKTIVEPDPPRVAGKRATNAVPLLANRTLPPELANHPQYEMLRELGRGGMGVVYLARNKLMDRLEVLKVLNKEMLAKQGTGDRFLREIQSAARLHHPNVVAAYTALQMGDLLVFAMEYVEGEDLAKLVRARGPLPVLNACYFAYQAAQGLQHAHECGMIHRDIKPGNLILFRQGKKGIVKILDFGLAKVTSEQRLDRTLTQEGQMLGTPDYIAPEQTLDAQKADIRADLYSLGCTLYHLLSGSPPFSGNSLYEVLQAHHSIEAKPLNLVRPEVPVELAAVVAKMMAKEPHRRYQTPAEVVQVLKPFLKPGGLTSPQPDLSQVPSQISRSAVNSGSARTPGDDDPSPSLAPMAAMQPAERWKSLIEMVQVDPSSAAKSAIRKRRGRQPPWMWPLVAVGALLFGLITAWASGIFSVKTKDGVIVLPDLPPDLLSAPFDQAAAEKAQQTWASHLKASAEHLNSIRMRFVVIPPGEFQMGSPDDEGDRLGNEKRHPVHITKPFYLGVYEVTQSEFQEVMARNPSDFSNSGGQAEATRGVDTSQFPVEMVTWYDAIEFCDKLSDKEGRRPYYRLTDIDRESEGWIKGAIVSVEGGNGYRLPTEAEWEYACRAGTTSTFNFGTDNNGAKCNCDGKQPYGTEEQGTALGRPAPVGSYRQNAFGLYDMHGNVWEWCWDVFDAGYYSNSPASDPAGPSAGPHRVNRGGCWRASAARCRAAFRNNFRTPPQSRVNTLGFRVALSVESNATEALDKSAGAR
jgi:formylglycine-generating enzyme required for sulfatase activity/serine/threonine protein kinase